MNLLGTVARRFSPLRDELISNDADHCAAREAPRTMSSSLAPERVPKVRVAVVGDTGCGKSSLVRLMLESGEPGATTSYSTTRRRGGSRLPDRTIGCEAEVRVLHHPPPGASGDSTPRPHFVEIFDIGGHDEYKGERSVFYDALDGVVLVHDLSFRGSAKKLERWAREIAATGTFAPAASTPQWNAAPGTPLAMPPSSSNVLHGFGGLPVPALVVANKADLHKRRRDDESDDRGGKGGARRRRRRFPSFGGDENEIPGDGIVTFVKRLWERVAVALHLPRTVARKVTRRVASFGRLDGALLPTHVGDASDPNAPGAAWTDARAGYAGLSVGSGLRCVATRGRMDRAVVDAFFHELLTRRFGGEGAGGASSSSSSSRGTTYGTAGFASGSTDAQLRGAPRSQWMGGDRVDAGVHGDNLT